LIGEDLLRTINLSMCLNQSFIKLKEISKLRINLTETFYDTEITKFNGAQTQLKTKSLFLF